MASSTAMAVDKPKLDVDAYLTEALSLAPPELQPYFESFRTLYQRKLWHQLTMKLFEFFRNDLSKPFSVNVFEKFVLDFAERLNQLRLVEMGVIVSKEIDNPATHLQFLTSLLSRVNTENAPEAHVLLLSSLAYAKLVYGDLEGTLADKDKAGKILDDLDGVDPAVNAAYYSIAADYHKAKAEYAPYYKNSLLYLACIDPEKDLSPEERLLRAHNLSISALLGESIYNFGELLMHPILSSLDGTPHEWIKKLLFTFNSGDIGRFEALAPLFSKEPVLQENYPFLRQKVSLMALIDSVFRRNADERALSFQTLSQEVRLPWQDIEYLAMKALSLGLIKGSIDQVSETLHVTWVQPRVLDRDQIRQLADRLKAWTDKLQTVEQRIAPELLVSS